MFLRPIRRCLIPAFLPVLVGCPPTTMNGLFPAGVQIGSGFDTATPLPLDSTGRAVFSGNLVGSKIDVFDLGPCEPGDRLIISVSPPAGSPLDPTIAVFSADQEVFALNDDFDAGADRYDSFIDDTVTIASPHYYLAITKFFFDNVAGAYDATIEINRGQAIPTLMGQVLLLNFAAGSINIAGESAPFTFDAFDAADIDPNYAGQTAVIKAKIVEVVRQNFRDFGIFILTSDDPPVDNTNCVLSTIHFGAFSKTKFGVAQDVDQSNRARCDDGIVFTDDFDKPFATKPSVDGIAIAIANVAAHEAGHLLGLNHTTDVTDLMDTTGSASTLLADQEFKTAEFSASIFPIGNQNGRALLNRVIPQ